MHIRYYFLSFFLIIMLGACAADSAENAEDARAEAIVEEIQALDSLNAVLDSTTRVIEASIEDVETAVDALDN